MPKPCFFMTGRSFFGCVDRQTGCNSTMRDSRIESSGSEGRRNEPREGEREKGRKHVGGFYRHFAAVRRIQKTRCQVHCPSNFSPSRDPCRFVCGSLFWLTDCHLAPSPLRQQLLGLGSFEKTPQKLDQLREGLGPLIVT